MKTIHVLLVDDDVAMQKLTDLALADRGMKVYGACDTAEADVILSKNKIDVIVCDVLMSPENGLDYCKRLRDRSVGKPVILMSAQVSPLAMQDASQDRAAAYLIKPFGLEQMYQRILEAL